MQQWYLSKEPRDWQVNALKVWKLHDRGIASVVTGGGKTVFAFLCMIDYERRNADAKYIVLVPSNALADQWYVSLIDEMHVNESDISILTGTKKFSRLSKINIAVINSAREGMNLVGTDQNIFLIVDECHRAGSEQNAKALSAIIPKATLGLSATPEREYDEGFINYIKPALGEIIYEYGYVEAHADGVITPFDLTNVRVSLSDDEAAEYKRYTIQLAREYSKNGKSERFIKILQRRSNVSINAVSRIPASIFLADRHRGIRTIIFHEKIAAAKLILEVLLNRGHRATIYNSSVGASIRRDNLRLFRSGIVDILVACKALDEGMNVPETSIAIIASATASQRQRIQRLGRVLRPATGKDYATIYTLFATESEEKRLRSEQERLNEISNVSWIEVKTN